MNAWLKQLTEKKRRLDQARPLPPELVKNLDEWYKVELTFTSNAIEGNTLSRAETISIPFADENAKCLTLRKLILYNIFRKMSNEGYTFLYANIVGNCIAETITLCAS